MKKILLSILSISFVLVAAVYATGAFFSDTETSTGNLLQAGAFDLMIDSEAHYAGLVCEETDVDVFEWNDDSLGVFNNTRPELLGTPCEGTWSLKDLEEGDTFFSLTDIKPGDTGENTLSIHVDNDAWLCADITLTEDDDNSSTEPELEDGDTAEDAGNAFDGELAENVRFTAWLDQGTTPGWQGGETDTGEGDNVWQGDTAEPLLFTNEEGPASDVLGGVTYALADSTTPGGPILATETNYLGLQWCHGVMTVDTGADTISCDGSSLDNTTQTDSFMADVAFRAEQARNNPDFTCEAPSVTPTGALTGTVTPTATVTPTVIVTPTPST